MSSNETLAHFMRNPRPYLAPNLPRPPCKLCVLGPPHSGKTTVARQVAQRYNAEVNSLLSLSLHRSHVAAFQGQCNTVKGTTRTTTVKTVQPRPLRRTFSSLVPFSLGYRMLWFFITMLSDWPKKKISHNIFTRSYANDHSSTPFPAVSEGCMYLLHVLIGPFGCLVGTLSLK